MPRRSTTGSRVGRAIPRAGTVIWALCGLLSASQQAAAQTDFQLWGNFTLDWVKSDRFAYELDFEPKALVYAPDDEPDWRSLDVTPNVEYSPNGWLDLVAESVVGYTKQTDDVNTLEVSPRVGFRLHVFERAVRTPGLRERSPSRRIVIRDLVRFESRNLFYTGAEGGSSCTFRFRNRLEFLTPLNKEKLTENGARYLMADWEFYVPAGEPDERYATKHRVRAGLGYRHSFSWRYQVLYIWDRTRNTIDESFTSSAQSLDVQVKRVF